MTDDDIRFWTRAGAIVSLLSFGLSVAAPNLPTPLQAGPPWVYESGFASVLIFLAVAMSLAILWRSRLAAFLALTGAASTPFLANIWSGSWWRLLVDLPLALVLVKSFEATLEYHRNRLAETPVTPGRTLRRAMLRIAIVLLVVAAIWALAVAPPGYVMSGRQVPAAYRTAMDELKLLEPGEQVLYFSSDALWDIRQGMYVLTDRRLIVHSDTWAEPTQRVEFAQIADVIFLSGSGSWDSSYVVIEFDMEPEVMFPLSQQSHGDRRFHEALVTAWRAHRSAKADGTARQ